MQRVLAHAPPANYPVLPLGSIGARAVAERNVLSFIATAPGLNPDTITFTATNLPPGAVFDSTGMFHWCPAASESGTYSNIHLAAGDGTQTASEDIAITVAEANLAIAGTVQSTDGTPAPGITIILLGARGGRRTASSDVFGHFEFDDLAPARYTVTMGPPSTRRYNASPRAVAVVLDTSDRTNINFVVTPR